MKRKENYPVLNLTSQSDLLFFGKNGHGISRYDTVKYPVLKKINDKMQSFFWRPIEFDMSQEKRSFDKMTDAEQFVFTSNLKRQILLDSIQGRAPALVFLPWCTDPSLENCILTWTFFESIHSESYTHIIRAIYPNPSIIFEDITSIKPIADCATEITSAYDGFIKNPTKENLYLALIAANALEAIRFYVSFACTFSYLERAMVEGSAKTIKFIARDETQHLGLVQHVIKLLPKDDPDYIEIMQDNRVKAQNIFINAANQEKQWANYLFKDGPILGLNEKILSDYVDYLLVRRMSAIGLSDKKDLKQTHPIPWVEKHFTSDNTQVAPQEVEVPSYTTSSLINDINELDISSLWNK